MDHLSEIRNFKLNKTCKTFIFNIRDCSDFEIYQENFGEELKEEEKETESNSIDYWYQSKVFVKGFNDVQSIWN